MAKQSDLSRMSWCIVAFLITFVTLTSATSAQDAMDICNRIKSYKLKIRTMGLVGDLFIVLTDEGHLFYLPRDNLQNVDTSNPTLKIDHVPLNANRVFGAALDYNIRQDSSHLLFFLLVDSKSKIEFLMCLKVEQWLLRFQAHHLDWKKSHKRHKLSWTRNKQDDLMPLCFIVNADYRKAECAQTIQMLEILDDNNRVQSREGISQQICMNGDSLNVKPIESNFNSCSEFSQASYTAFEWKRTGSPSFVFHLDENGGLYFRIKKIEGSFDCAESSWSSLSDFIQCGAHFIDNTSRWLPPEVPVESSIASTSSNETQAITTNREKGTRWISGWTIVTMILIGLSVCLVIMILRLYMKTREPKKRNRKNKHQHSSIGSSAISSTIGSSSTIDSSNVTSSGGLSGASSCPISASSSSSSAVTSFMNSSGTSSAASQSKLSSNRSFMDGIFSWLKKNQKKNAKQRAKDKKAKENKKKGSKK